jgi:glutathione synthase/RimK-type ligase-like ATP-grasp enzyme
MKQIYLLTDYLGNFESKVNSKIYLGGMDKSRIQEHFKKHGYKTNFISMHSIDFRNEKWKDAIVLYTGQEDVDYRYKSYIEDIILGLELSGAKAIPSYKYLRANNNKVFMEIVRDLSPLNEMKNIISRYYGTAEDAINNVEDISYPVVIKGAGGAGSKRVALAKNRIELKSKVKTLASSPNLKEDIRDYFRKIKHRGYRMQSRHRRKFILQNFIPELQNDWKVLIFGSKFFIVERNIRKNDFRASGSGLEKMLFGTKSSVPEGIFEIAKKIKDNLNVPNISLDFAFYNDKFFLLEFQTLYFGSSGQSRSDCCFYFDGNKFVKSENNQSLEELYVDSIIGYI